MGDFSEVHIPNTQMIELTTIKIEVMVILQSPVFILFFSSNDTEHLHKTALYDKIFLKLFRITKADDEISS